MGTWEHVLPLFVPGYTVLFPTYSDNVLNVPLCGYTCTRILYPVTNSVPTYLRLERPRRRGRSKRPGTLFVTGYNMRVHTANCSATFPTYDAPNKSQRFFCSQGTSVPYVPGSQKNMALLVNVKLVKGEATPRRVVGPPTSLIFDVRRNGGLLLQPIAQHRGAKLALVLEGYRGEEGEGAAEEPRLVHLRWILHLLGH